MEKALIAFVLIVIFGNMIGNARVQDFLNWVWLGFTVLFCLFLIIYHRLDHKKYPGHKNKKNREG